VLGDAAGLPRRRWRCGWRRAAGLAVVDVTHDGDDRRTGLEVVLLALVLTEVDVEGSRSSSRSSSSGTRPGRRSRARAEQLEGVLVHRLGGRGHLAEVEQHLTSDAGLALIFSAKSVSDAPATQPDDRRAVAARDRTPPIVGACISRTPGASRAWTCARCRRTVRVVARTRCRRTERVVARTRTRLRGGLGSRCRCRGGGRLGSRSRRRCGGRRSRLRCRGWSGSRGGCRRLGGFLGGCGLRSLLRRRLCLLLRRGGLHRIPQSAHNRRLNRR
jgi:hypothetical protein